MIATMLVVLAFATLLVCGLYISSNAADPFGVYLGSGITFLISLQACINIGVVTSALPNKGLPLPFISYGGSNLAIMLMSVGLLLSIARFARVESGIFSRSARARDELPGKRSKGNPFKTAKLHS